ncbi:MAG TPA: hypothetical protein VN727_09800, partial [Candidatus Binatia bacterium]|nr:hypothetical protein [Candidatus Binatia bacterium]
ANASGRGNHAAGSGGQPNNTAGVSHEEPAPEGPSRTVGAAFASGALGVGQSSDTLLTVYGCSRMGTQVTCDTDLSNQNESVTQIKSMDQWKDVYLLDDRGDHHMRSMAIFENNVGDQRMQIDLPYGEKSRYILVFNGVSSNVKSVTLKSTKEVLDIEGISVTTPNGGSDGQAPQAPSGMQPANAPSGHAQGVGKPPHS